MLTRVGYVIVAFRGSNPRKPGEGAGLFGPVTSNLGGGHWENLQTNGANPFAKISEATGVQKRFRHTLNTQARVVPVQMRIADNREDVENLRRYGSYVVSMETDFDGYTVFYGRAWVRGKRVDQAHDSWAPFSANGFSPFRDYQTVIGERGLGVMSELSRQAQTRTKLIGMCLDWRRAL